MFHRMLKLFILIHAIGIARIGGRPAARARGLRPYEIGSRDGRDHTARRYAVRTGGTALR